jgi:hypothetical protein
VNPPVTGRGQAELDHELLWTSVGVAAAALAWVLARNLLPVPFGACVFKAITGWPCVTCGGTRALRALFAGHVADALRANPLVVLVAAGWAGYGGYAVGALAGAWPRVRIQLDRRTMDAAKWMVVGLVTLTWAYLAVNAT